MKKSYFDLIDQTYYFPQEGFDLRNGSLTFHGVSLEYLIEKYGTPFRFIYLPKIGDQIKKARNLFNRAIRKNDYTGRYYYCYCTKCNHFAHVINEALKHDVHLETSSSFDIDLILDLFKDGKIDKNISIVNNGYKTNDYLRKIVSLYEKGFKNVLVVLDSQNELTKLEKVAGEHVIKVGMRLAIQEEPQSPYHTSRLGISGAEIEEFFATRIKNNDRVELKMLHFFVDSGIRDNMYFWGEFQRALELYISIKKQSETLTAFNIGGGLPIRNNLGFEYNYEYMISEIVSNIKNACVAEKVPDPDIYTEFGKYTVGESGAIIFEVLEQKQQNDTECWYLINNSLMNTIPDAWSINEKFILLPINKWGNEYMRAHIGGISCDHSDYYNSEDLNQDVLLPAYDEDDETPLYLGFFHTGAYQDAISGYGGIKHCLIPAPKHVIIDKDEKGNIIDYMYRAEQSVGDMFNILGYDK